jgi:hypothetical protein
MGCLSEEPPHRVDIPARALTNEECALLDVLLGSLLATPEVRAQVASARVVGVCSCGCRSIFLEAGSDTPTVEFPEARLPVEITATTRANSEPWGLSVTLHILLGRIEELEVWGGTRDGTNNGELPKPRDLELIA